MFFSPSYDNYWLTAAPFKWSTIHVWRSQASQAHARALFSQPAFHIWEIMCIELLWNKKQEILSCAIVISKSSIIQCCTAHMHIMHPASNSHWANGIRISALGHCLGTQLNIFTLVHVEQRFYFWLTSHWRHPYFKYFDILVHFCWVVIPSFLVIWGQCCPGFMAR